MAWYNPWGTIAALEDTVVILKVVVSKYEEQIKKHEFVKKENEREIKLLEKDLKEAKAALAEASKNDTRDTKGRFTKAKK